jgi:predicted RNase H-like nuclease (RuvC/YqgF family)
MNKMTEEEAYQYTNNTDHFYRGVVWGQLEERLDRMERNAAVAHASINTKIESLDNKVDTLNGKLKYIYGAIGVILFGIPFLWDWLKIKFHL